MKYFILTWLLRLVMLLALPLLPVLAFMSIQPLSDAWRDWKQEWRDLG